MQERICHASAWWEPMVAILPNLAVGSGLATIMLCLLLSVGMRGACGRSCSVDRGQMSVCPAGRGRRALAGNYPASHTDPDHAATLTHHHPRALGRLHGTSGTLAAS